MGKHAVTFLRSREREGDSRLGGAVMGVLSAATDKPLTGVDGC